MTWVRMQQGTVNPDAERVMQAIGNEPLAEVWSNDIYECQVRYNPTEGLLGMVWLSIKRWDRAPVRDWRHLQSIKNEVVGMHREAVELFPDESRLVDGANQTHLWVMPVGVRLPFGMGERSVVTHEEADTMLRKLGLPKGMDKGRQRPWEPGLATGKRPFGRDS